MNIGQVLMSGENVLSPWFPREADNAIFSWEKIQDSGSVGLTVTVWHKTTEETGEGTQITGSWSTDGDISYKKFTGLRELVRFEYTASAPGSVVQGTVLEPGGAGAEVNVPIAAADIGWVKFRMLAPTWFNTADA